VGLILTTVSCCKEFSSRRSPPDPLNLSKSLPLELARMKQFAKAFQRQGHVQAAHPAGSTLGGGWGSRRPAWYMVSVVRPRVSPDSKGSASTSRGPGWGVRLRWRGVWGRGWGWRRLDLDALVSTLVGVDRVVVAS
jgi:hypothetical protein